MEEKPKKKKLIPVRVIYNHGKTSLVEWEANGLHRAFIPVDQAQEGKVDAEVLETGMPYGLPWEKYIKPTTVTPEQLANALRVAGIWTKEDLWNNPQSVMGAIQGVVGIHLGSLVEAVEKKEA